MLPQHRNDANAAVSTAPAFMILQAFLLFFIDSIIANDDVMLNMIASIIATIDI
ncbi:MAG: hypothetical protein ARM1_0720 [Candidatus Micrarchaeota archaeon]|nr:MAG: hypothetical protein ARM1_0720 [Candidatus Micrarchaeota archaeon]